MRFSGILWLFVIDAAGFSYVHQQPQAFFTYLAAVLAMSLLAAEITTHPIERARWAFEAMMLGSPTMVTSPAVEDEPDSALLHGPAANDSRESSVEPTGRSTGCQPYCESVVEDDTASTPLACPDITLEDMVRLRANLHDLPQSEPRPLPLHRYRDTSSTLADTQHLRGNSERPSSQSSTGSSDGRGSATSSEERGSTPPSSAPSVASRRSSLRAGSVASLSSEHSEQIANITTAPASKVRGTSIDQNRPRIPSAPSSPTANVANSSNDDLQPIDHSTWLKYHQNSTLAHSHLSDLDRRTGVHAENFSACKRDLSLDYTEKRAVYQSISRDLTEDILPALKRIHVIRDAEIRERRYR